MAKIPYNPSTPNEDDIAQMISTVPLGDRAYTLFMGAGCSVNSNIPSVDGMIKGWKRDLFEKHKKKTSSNDYKIWEKETYPSWLEDWEKQIRDPNEKEYSVLFRYFHKQPRRRQLYIETIIEGKEPTFGYLYLAGLIAENRFNRILTTNFDDLLSDALFRYYDKKALVSAFDSSITSFRIESTRPKIIKLHGDFLYDNLKNISHEIKNLDTIMEDKMYQVCKDAGLIVVGYSGRDESIMSPIRDMIRKAQYLNMGLHWCVLEPHDDKKEIEIPDLLYDIYANHRDKVHIYVINGFDELMEKIFVKCECKLPTILEFPEKINLCNKFENAIRAGTTANLTDTMNDHLGLFLEKASKNEINLDTIVNLAMTERTTANNSFNNKDNEKCWDYIKKCEERLKIIDESENATPKNKMMVCRIKSSIYLLYASLYYETGAGDYLKYLDKTIEAVNRGIEIYSDYGLIDVPSKRTLHYNFCCAYGLKRNFTGKITKEEEEMIKEEIEIIQSLDFEGKEIRELFNDSDFVNLTYLLPKK